MLRTFGNLFVKKSFSIYDIIKSYSIGIGIAVLIPLTMISGINVFMPVPSNKAVWELQDQLQQLKEEAKKGDSLGLKESMRETKIALKEKEVEYKKNMNRYYYYYLAIALVIGIALAFIGILLEPEFLSISLIIGGLLAITYALTYGWNEYTDLLRFFIFLVMITTVIFLEIFLFSRPGRKLWRFGSALR